MTVLIHARERPRLVVERDRNVLAAHGRRINLRLEIGHQRVAGNEPIVAQDQALAAGLPTAAGSIVFTCIPRRQPGPRITRVGDLPLRADLDPRRPQQSARSVEAPTTRRSAAPARTT